MLTTDGVAKVTDFGLARARSGPGARPARAPRRRSHPDGRGRRRRDPRLRLAGAGRGRDAEPPGGPVELRPLRARELPRRADLGVRPRGAGGARRLPPRRARGGRSSARCRSRWPISWAAASARRPTSGPTTSPRSRPRCATPGRRSRAGPTRGGSRWRPAAPPTPSTTARCLSWTSAAPAEAETLWRRALEAEASARGGDLQLRRSRPGPQGRLPDPELLRRMEEACASHAGLPRAHQLLGRVHLALGQPARPLAALERAAALGRCGGPRRGPGGRARGDAAAPADAARTARPRRAPSSLAPDGRTVAAGSGAEVRVWDAGTGQLVRTMPMPEGPVRSLALLPDGRFLAGRPRERAAGPLGPGLGSARPVLRAPRRLRDEPRGRARRPLRPVRRVGPGRPPLGPGERAHRPRDGRSRGRRHRRGGGRDVPRLRRAATARCGSGPSTTGGASARCGATQGRVLARRPRRGAGTRRLRGRGRRRARLGTALPRVRARPGRSHGQAVAAVALSPDGARVLSASADRIGARSSTASGSSRSLRLDAAVQAMAVAPDGTTWAGHGTIRERPARGPPPPAAAGPLPPGLRLRGGGPRLFFPRPHRGGPPIADRGRPRDRRVPRAPRARGARPRAVGSGARRVGRPLRAAAATGAALRLGGVAARGPRGPGPGGGRGRLRLESPHRRARRDGSALWDLATRKAEASLSGHDGAVTASPSPGPAAPSRRGVTERVRLWDLAGRRAVAVLEGHGETVAAVDATADGVRAASASWDGTVRLWDLRRRGAPARPRGPRRPRGRRPPLPRRPGRGERGLGRHGPPVGRGVGTRARGPGGSRGQRDGGGAPRRRPPGRDRRRGRQACCSGTPGRAARERDARRPRGRDHRPRLHAGRPVPPLGEPGPHRPRLGPAARRDGAHAPSPGPRPGARADPGGERSPDGVRRPLRPPLAPRLGARDRRGGDEPAAPPQGGADGAARGRHRPHARRHDAGPGAHTLREDLRRAAPAGRSLPWPRAARRVPWGRVALGARRPRRGRDRLARLAAPRERSPPVASHGAGRAPRGRPRSTSRAYRGRLRPERLRAAPRADARAATPTPATSRASPPGARPGIVADVLDGAPLASRTTPWTARRLRRNAASALAGSRATTRSRRCAPGSATTARRRARVAALALGVHGRSGGLGLPPRARSRDGAPRPYRPPRPPHCASGSRGASCRWTRPGPSPATLLAQRRPGSRASRASSSPRSSRATPSSPPSVPSATTPTPTWRRPRARHSTPSHGVRRTDQVRRRHRLVAPWSLRLLTARPGVGQTRARHDSLPIRRLRPSSSRSCSPPSSRATCSRPRPPWPTAAARLGEPAGRRHPQARPARPGLPLRRRGDRARPLDRSKSPYYRLLNGRWKFRFSPTPGGAPDGVLRDRLRRRGLGHDPGARRTSRSTATRRPLYVNIGYAWGWGTPPRVPARAELRRLLPAPLRGAGLLAGPPRADHLPGRLRRASTSGSTARRSATARTAAGPPSSTSPTS